MHKDNSATAHQMDVLPPPPVWFTCQDLSFVWSPTNIRICLIFLESSTYIFATDSLDLSSFKFSGGLCKTHLVCNRVCISRSRSSKVIGFGTDRKCIAPFEMCGIELVMRRKPEISLKWTVLEILQVFFSWPTLFHPNFAVIRTFPLDHTADTERLRVKQNLKLISREIIFEVFQFAWKTYLNVTVRRATYCVITAHCDLCKCVWTVWS